METNPLDCMCARHVDHGAGTIRVELRLVCKDTESEAFTSDVSTLNPFHFVFTLDSFQYTERVHL